METVRRLGALKGSEIREAKEVLAYEATKLCHGEEDAEKARHDSRKLFGEKIGDSSDSIPSVELHFQILEEGIPAYLLFEKSGLCKTRGEARRLISQGGGYINQERIEVFGEGSIAIVDDLKRLQLIRKGKTKTVKKRRRNKGYGKELQMFIHAVENGGQMPIPFKESVTATLLTFTIKRSLREGTPQDIDLEQFGL